MNGINVNFNELPYEVRVLNLEGKFAVLEFDANEIVLKSDKDLNISNLDCFRKLYKKFSHEIVFHGIVDSNDNFNAYDIFINNNYLSMKDMEVFEKDYSIPIVKPILQGRNITLQKLMVLSKKYKNLYVFPSVYIQTDKKFFEKKLFERTKLIKLIDTVDENVLKEAEEFLYKTINENYLFNSNETEWWLSHGSLFTQLFALITLPETKYTVFNAYKAMLWSNKNIQLLEPNTIWGMAFFSVFSSFHPSITKQDFSYFVKIFDKQITHFADIYEVDNV